MKTYTILTNLFTNLSQNQSSNNSSLGGQLINDRHRYLIQKYFDNERSFTTSTVGAQDLTLTASLSAGDTSATLSTAWTYPSCTQLVVFSNSDQRPVHFSQNQTGITWQVGLSDTATTAISTVGVQAYPVPADISKVKNMTVTVGQLQYTPSPIQSIQDWTRLNAIPYASDIPNYFFIYNNQVNIWPIPSTTGNIITINYKRRVPDLSYADYSTGTLSGITVGSNEITGVSTSWNTTGTYPLNTDLSFFNLYIRIDPPKGDGLWYPIYQFTSDTSLILSSPIQTAPSSTATSYTIGQLPLLEEDFHDMIVYDALRIYFSTIVNDDSKYKKFEGLVAERLDMLKDYAGTKSVNVDLGQQPIQNNPNLYIYASN